MRKRNWKKYNLNLVQRGSITFLIEKKTLNEICNYKPKSTGGRPLKYPKKLIEYFLLIKIQYNLTYRALQGFAESVFSTIKKWFPIPNYSTVCKRSKELEAALPALSRKRPAVIALDASGIKVYGEGEWKRKIHGPGRPRKWMKMHIAVDLKSQEVIAEKLTESNCPDNLIADYLISQVPRGLTTVCGDGAYDAYSCRKAIKDKGAKPLIPPPRNGVLKSDPDRNQALLEIKGLGGDEIARSIWGKLTGYSYRSLVETAFSRYKRIFGPRLFSKSPLRQVIENRLKWLILNKMIAS